MDPNLSDGTKEVYETQLRTLLMPAFEHLALREITVGRVDRFLKTQSAKSYSMAKHSRVLLNLLMGYALRHEAIRHNPLAGTSRLHKPPAPPKALTLEELQAIRHAAATWRTGMSLPGRSLTGRYARSSSLLGTSARIGEALGLRACDVDMAATPPTVQIRGTVVARKGKGVYRQAAPKTDASNRTVAIPQFAAEVIRQRLALVPEGSAEHLLLTSLSPRPRPRIWFSPSWRTGDDAAGLSSAGSSWSPISACSRSTAPGQCRRR